MPSPSPVFSRTHAVVLEEPGRIDLRDVALAPLSAGDLLVEVDHSGISTGTERLLWSGRMPAFPGMGYPLVPGYESVGRVIDAGAAAIHAVGEHVFVPGSTGFLDVRGLFGGASRHVVVPGTRVLPVDPAWGERAVLLALAATAHHAIGLSAPDLIVGHGVLGRLLSRLCVARGLQPVVWETAEGRSGAAAPGVTVLHPDSDDRRAYGCIVDASGDAGLLDTLIARLAPGGEVVLAGFYEDRLAFDFARAFLREPRLRIAAQWQAADLKAVHALVACGQLSLDGLITHREPASRAARAYETAFTDAACLKMTLDWRHGA